MEAQMGSGRTAVATTPTASRTDAAAAAEARTTAVTWTTAAARARSVWRAAATVLSLGLALSPGPAGTGCRHAGDDSNLGGSGTIECTQVEVSPLVGGSIVALPLEEGTRLEAGQTVARIDDVELKISLEQARAQVDGARARLSLAEEGARQEDIQRARAEVRRAGAELASAEADLVRLEGLLDKGSATRKQRDDAATRVEVAQAQVDASERTLEKLQRGSRNQEIQAARAAMDAAEAQAALVEKRIGDCVITAPMSGVVTSKVREPGEVVNPGAALFTLSRLDSVWLTIFIPGDQISRVRLGQKARVTVDGQPGRRFEGRVIHVASEAEFTPRNIQTRDERVKLVYAVKIGLDNPEGVFKPGMPADAELEE